MYIYNQIEDEIYFYNLQHIRLHLFYSLNEIFHVYEEKKNIHKLQPVINNKNFADKSIIEEINELLTPVKVRERGNVYK